MKFHYRMFSRRVILGTAVVLAVTGATGAAAVLAPSDLGLSRFVPNVTAQLIAPDTNNDVFAQLPFDQIAQAPITTPSTTLTDAPTPAPIASAPAAPAPVAQAPAARTTSAPGRVAQSPALRGPAVRDPAAQGPVAQAPVGQAPVAQAPITQAPITQTPIAVPQGRQIMTSGPGVVVRQQHAQIRPVYRPRVVYRSDDYCAD